jgi:filamentous hemagglutinin family protein
MSPSNAVKRMEPAARTNVNGGRFTPRSKHPSPESIMDRSDNPRLNIKPIAYAIGLLLLSGAARAAGPRPFSGDWFAVKGATRAATAEAARSGGLPGMTPPLAQQQQANAQLARSIANLGQTAAAIAAAQAQQAAARQAALNAPGDVPDGLASGGLQVDNNPATQGWLNAAAPTQSSAGGHTTVSINQTKDKAILNWQTFNVGKNTEVDFHQQASWAVLNRVNDPNGRPSEIEGQIKGDGTVLLMNRNGIVFTGSSQVNVRNLAAAAAAMSDDQFTTHGIYSAQANGAYSSAFTDAAGKVLVQSGAQITTATPASATQGGGYILLLGQEVDNRGTLSTPQGQTAMAAGDYFILRPGQGTDSNAYSTTRGNEVVAGYSGDGNGALGTGAGENGAADGGTASGNNAGTAPVSGRVSNHGLIQSLQGDITLTGHAVVQDGVALSSSTVNNRGTVHLLNPASDQTGSVTVTGNGVTAVVLDGSDQTALDSQRASLITQSAVQDLARRGAAQGVFDNLSRQDDREDLSRVEIVSGGGVDFAGGSLTLATGGQIAVSAAGASQVEDGATLDVSGSVGVNVAMASNNVEVNVQGNEQRDSPLNRDTQDLNNSTIWVDRRSLIHVAAGTGGDADDRWYTAGGLLEVGGYLGLSPHGIGEWAAEGGTVSFSGGGVRTDGGSAINLSGGSLNVQSGYLQMSWLRGADGRLYDVSSAPGDIQYASLYKGFEEAHARWGEEAAAYFYNPLIAPRQRYENGYTVGRDAGRLIIATDASALDGNIIADTYQGPQQGQGTDASLDGYLQSQTAVARGGQLILGSYQSAANGDVKNGPVGVFYNLTPVADNIVFGDGVYHGAGASGADAQAGNGDTAGTDADANGAKSQTDDSGNAADNSADDSNLHPGEIDLNSDLLNGFGLGSIIAAAKNGVTVDRAMTVTTGGTLALYAPNVAVNANLTARGGSIALGNVLSLVADSGIRADTAITAPAGGVTAVTIANGATLDTRGLWSNLLLDPAANEDLPYVNGGSVTVRSTGGVALAQGAAIDVSSGAALLANGSLNGGKGGDVTLAAGYTLPDAQTQPDGPLELDGDIRAYGVSGGGTLTIESGQAIGIGGDLLTNNGTLKAGETATVNLRLAEEYVIAAGSAIPMNFSITVTNLAPGKPTDIGYTPQATPNSPIVPAADWVVPSGISYLQANGSYYYPGYTVPAGAQITFVSGSIPAGYVVPANAFPGGLPVSPVSKSYSAGTVVAEPLVVPIGTLIAPGNTLPVDVAVTPYNQFSGELFQDGFAHYSISGRDGVTVSDGTQLNVAMPVYLPDMNALAGLASGEDPAAFMSVWTPPVYQVDPFTATLTQRGGASLSLSAGSDVEIDGAPLTIGQGAVVSVDPGQSIDLHANGQLTVDGRLNAWGGSISLASSPALPGGDRFSPTRSVWIGDNGVLDVAGRAYGALDSQGRTYGVAPKGGSITVSQSDAYVIVRPGALLDASGSALTVDRSAGGAPQAPSQSTTLAGDGGGIELHSNNGIYLDGTLRADAGGPGATGGSLTLVMDTPRIYYPGTDVIEPDLANLHNIQLVQQASGSGLAADLAPGKSDDQLTMGYGTLGVNQVEAGGFAALTLSTHDLIVFDGDVDLSLGRSLNLKGGILTVADATPDAQVRLAAPYIRLDGGSWAESRLDGPSYLPGFLDTIAGVAPKGNSAITLAANLVDIYGTVASGASGMQGQAYQSVLPTTPVTADGFATVNFNINGDMRLAGGFTASGNLNVTADQIYPLSGQNASLIAGSRTTGIDRDSQLVIRSNGGTPDVPYSVFGNLLLLGGTVDQGGVARAPLGTIALNTTGALTLGTLWNMVLDSFQTTTPVLTDPQVILRGGSLTSVSAAGLDIPFGGTVDGVTYSTASLVASAGYQGDGLNYNLADIFISRGSDGGDNRKDQSTLAAGVSLGGTSVIGEPGAVIDLSGGGELHGEGFVSGRGGSVNVLTTPLVNANPIINSFSSGTDGVYAILPGYASDYAPVIADNGAGNPAIGRQIVLESAVDGLPAGTYTLLPSSFALLPGAFRVELGPQQGALTTPPMSGTVAMPGGSWITSGTLQTANTGQQDALPSRLIISSADTVRRYAQYNETSYSQFAQAQANQFSTVRTRLPEDGKMLNLVFTQSDEGTPLSFAGTVLFGGVDSGVAKGIDGAMIITGGPSVVEIRNGQAAATPGDVSLVDTDVNNFKAPTLMIGAAWSYFNGQSSLGDSARIYFGYDGKFHNGAVLGDNTTLKAGQVFLVGNDVTVGDGAIIDTRGFGDNVIDSDMGYVYANGLIAGETFDNPAILAVGNGRLDFLGSEGAGAITVGDGASLLTEGTIAFAAPGALNLGAVNMGARYLTVSQQQINIGTADSLSSAADSGVLPAGWLLTQSVLDKLLHPATGSGLPMLERLSLTAGGAFNYFGSVTLDTGDSPVQFVLNTPAFYGWGNGDDVVRLVTRDLVWNGLVTGRGTIDSPYQSVAPAPVTAGGPGSGLGQLIIDADTVTFGYDALSQAQRQTTLDRLALGFSSMTIDAASRITANNAGSLTVAGSQGADGSRSGGDLLINTPLLTGAGGSSMSYNAAGALRVSAPDGVPAADTADVNTLGGSVSLKGQTVSLDTAVALPGGKLTLNADGDIQLGDNAHVDMAGRALAFFDVTKYSWGGDVSLQSDHGNINQAGGSRIDVSAAHNGAGSVSLAAANGAVTLDGGMAASGGQGYSDGRFTLTEARIDDGAFAELNNRLSDEGFFGARSFDIKNGDLTVGDGVRAHNVTISTDGGSLTVNGTVDASGASVGSIVLSARDQLHLTSTALLDAHGNTLVTDSYGQAIDASNRASLTLTSSSGRVMLDGGMRANLSAGDDVNRGQITINAPRIGANDIGLDAGGNLQLNGVGAIYVNAFRSYTPDGGIIDQGYLDGIDGDSRAFINAAWSNGGLQNRLAGLKAYGDAYHLRPGVEITSTGDLSTKGDLDLSGYRYGPNADPNVRGSGEPGVLVLRAAGDLKINGSINDGFVPPVSTPDGDINKTLLSSVTLTTDYQTPDSGMTLDTGTQLPAGGSLGFDLTLGADTPITLSDSILLPQDVVLGGAFYSNYLMPDVVTKADIILPGGQVIPAGTNTSSLVGVPGIIGTSADWLQLPSGTILKAGMNNIAQYIAGDAYAMEIQATTWRAGSDLAILSGYTGYTLPAPVQVAAGAVLPTGTYVSNAYTKDGERQIWAISPMLAAGSQSWSMRLVAGADLSAANTSTLQTGAQLAANGAAGNIALNDPFQINQNGLNVPLPGFSVVRTGTGSLELYSAGDFTEDSPYGVYTAGTAVDGTGAGTPWNVSRAVQADGTVFNTAYSGFEDTLNPQRMWYTTNGGDFTLSAGGNVTGSEDHFTQNIGGWLWRQGGDGIGQATAWGINFGSYVLDGNGSDIYSAGIGLSGFNGMGALGGGNATVSAGGNIGRDGLGDVYSGATGLEHDLLVAVGGSGRVIDGALVQTGGGTLTVNAGGTVYGGMYADLRGDIDVNAGNVGVVLPQSYGTSVNADPRGLDPYTAYSALSRAGASFAPGDGNVNVNSRGDAVLAEIDDPGRVALRAETSAADDQGQQGDAASWFTLWTQDTSVNVFSAGGNAAPLGTGGQGFVGAETAVLPPILRVTAAGGNIYYAARQNDDYLMPSPDGQLELLASGLISGGSVNNIGNGGGVFGLLGTSLSTIATPFNPAWRMLAAGDYSSGQIISSNYWGTTSSYYDSISYDSVYNYAYDPYNYAVAGSGGTMFMFGPNTLTDNSAAGHGQQSHVYALSGDIMNVVLGEARNVGSIYDGTNTTYYKGSKPVDMMAGGDIVHSGGVFVHDDPADISVVAAGGNIFYSTISVIGPGVLEVSAGGDIYQGNGSNLVSLGPIETGDTRPGATIVAQAGLGAGTPGVGATDYAGFANLYLNPDNLADPSLPLADQPGKTAAFYGDKLTLAQWLHDNYDYQGNEADAPAFLTAEQAQLDAAYVADSTAGRHDLSREFQNATQQHLVNWLETYFGSGSNSPYHYQDGTDALAFFNALPAANQRAFERNVFYAELIQGGREYNDPDSKRYGSYLRGRDAIAALFPIDDADGRAIERQGDIILYQGPSSNAGIRTIDGGSIQTLTPGGETLVGVEGVAPSASTPAGLITQGSGDIQMYSRDSILLGLSRIMTTFGGNIQAWSAEGDINAGRGAKTTIVYTPPKRVYDDWGDITLSPVVPSTGAGIATLAPIPEVPPGDIDLIAPLGTIDAGEAGIRVSGNVNIAALRVVNAENIQVQGKSTGIPTIAAVNVGALTSASQAASSAVQAAEQITRQSQRNQPSVISVQILGYGSERLEAGGDGATGGTAVNYNPDSSVQVLGAGPLSPSSRAMLTAEERSKLSM